MTKKLPKWRLEKPLFIDKKDKRYAKQVKQLKTRGFADSEIWGLDYSIACFILPRLKHFRDHAISHPMGLTEKEWKDVLDKMIRSFEFATKNGVYDETADEILEIYEGYELFGQWFRDLWS